MTQDRPDRDDDGAVAAVAAEAALGVGGVIRLPPGPWRAVVSAVGSAVSALIGRTCDEDPGVVQIERIADEPAAVRIAMRIVVHPNRPVLAIANDVQQRVIAGVAEEFDLLAVVSVLVVDVDAVADFAQERPVNSED